MRAEAREALERTARMNGAGGRGFREWFHGRTGAPNGMRGRSWNAAMVLFALRRLESTPS